MTSNTKGVIKSAMFEERRVGEVIYAEMFHGGTDAIAGNYRNFVSIIGTLNLPGNPDDRDV